MQLDLIRPDRVIFGGGNAAELVTAYVEGLYQEAGVIDDNWVSNFFGIAYEPWIVSSQYGAKQAVAGVDTEQSAYDAEFDLYQIAFHFARARRCLR